jgi:hypothetical protein
VWNIVSTERYTFTCGISYQPRDTHSRVEYRINWWIHIHVWNIVSTEGYTFTCGISYQLRDTHSRVEYHINWGIHIHVWNIVSTEGYTFTCGISYQLRDTHLRVEYHINWGIHIHVWNIVSTDGYTFTCGISYQLRDTHSRVEYRINWGMHIPYVGAAAIMESSQWEHWKWSLWTYNFILKWPHCQCIGVGQCDICEQRAHTFIICSVHNIPTFFLYCLCYFIFRKIKRFIKYGNGYR